MLKEYVYVYVLLKDDLVFNNIISSLVSSKDEFEIQAIIESTKNYKLKEGEPIIDFFKPLDLKI